MHPGLRIPEPQERPIQLYGQDPGRTMLPVKVQPLTIVTTGQAADPTGQVLQVIQPLRVAQAAGPHVQADPTPHLPVQAEEEGQVVETAVVHLPEAAVAAAEDTGNLFLI